MLNIVHEKEFLKNISKIKDPIFKERVIKQVEKIIENPEVGKPMKYNRKGTREVYISPYRLAYAYLPAENKLIFLKFIIKTNNNSFL
ncbi:type II toxin-antitoxin system RelE/ParE family toxin [Candidatus Woesearchaeota archaeon]|nr:type II toxin-antitoxin system RelE/ParE family toxin [Candidatus Woesearchaeota archaeon]